MAEKIRERVDDPRIAETLIPTDHGFGTRRVPMESGYYEVFNQANVDLVDVREAPISAITETGIATTDAERDFDVIIFATGFDAVTGGFDRIEIVGVDGERLIDAWAGGPRTYLGIGVAGFPNLFMLVGPHSAASFCNMPRCVEFNVEWIASLLEEMRGGRADPGRPHRRRGRRNGQPRCSARPNACCSRRWTRGSPARDRRATRPRDARCCSTRAASPSSRSGAERS